MASPDERQGDHTATTTCYFCHEIPGKGASEPSSAAAGLDLPLRSAEAVRVVGEEMVAPVGRMGVGTVPSDDAPDLRTLEPEDH
jgi:hypothetical protein